MGNKIKVGQVWGNANVRIAITYVDPDTDEIDYIHKDGRCASYDDRYAITSILKCKKLAEFKTFLDAINSKEFKGEGK